MFVVRSGLCSKPLNCYTWAAISNSRCLTKMYSIQTYPLPSEPKSIFSINYGSSRHILNYWPSSKLGLDPKFNCFTVQKRNFSIKETIDSALTTHVSFFKALSESAVVENTQNLLIQLHDSTGLPWWLSIVLSTLLVRITLTLPVAIYQVRQHINKWNPV